MIKVKDLKAGQVVFECERGMNHRLIIAHDPTRVENRQGQADGWETECEDGTVLFQSDRHSHYGPKLYEKPQYYVQSRNTTC